jgi:hypothetical protein
MDLLRHGAMPVLFGGIRAQSTLAAVISTPLAAPVIAATRLRGGNDACYRGAASFAAASVRTARAAGCTGFVIVRADSAFCSAAFTGAVRRAGTTHPGS